MSKRSSGNCQCEGWWEQEVYGRQPMKSLLISFDGNRITGTGTDMIGPFRLTGVISEGGRVVINKQYLGKHSVEYFGAYDGEGVLSGKWRIDPLRGRWMIRIRRVETDSTAEIVEFASMPCNALGSEPSNVAWGVGQN